MEKLPAREAHFCSGNSTKEAQLINAFPSADSDFFRNRPKQTMSVTSKRRGPRDTVEESWDEHVLAQCYAHARRVTVKDFLDRFKSFLGISGRMWTATSGRSALRDALAGTRGHTGRPKKSVLICSFNCVAVCEAVLQAGFLAETFDLSDRSGRIDWDEIAGQLRSDHHAIVVPHLFGVPSDFRPIRHAAANLGVLVIEDCAHTLGGNIGDAVTGTLGDLAVYSFTYNKAISLGGGGALVVNNTELRQLIQLPERGISRDCEMKEIERFVAYLRGRRGQLERPSISRRIRRRLFPRGITSQELMPTTGFGPLRAALGIWELDHYELTCDQRNRNASHFSSIPQWRAWHVSDNVSPAWLMQKVVPMQPVDVVKISHDLQALGLRVGAFNWPMTLDRFLSFPERPNASYVATYGLDIPVHQAMEGKELQLILNTLKSYH
jgi:dTDP-4-amino-4,6-dideoxygalactose transaminase